MSKLTEMAVSRVDGVDKPAIKKRWVLVKSEDAATEVEKDYAGAARSVIEAIAKEGVSFSDETVEVLRALVDLLELEGVEFAAKSDDASADEDDDDEDELDAEGNPVEKSVEKLAYTPDEVEAMLAKFAAKHGIDIAAVAKNDNGSPESGASPLRVTKSKQPKAQDTEAREVRKGTGLYSNIVNGEPASPYSA